MRLKSIRQFYCWYCVLVQAYCSAAFLAVKVGMLVTVGVSGGQISANFILHRPAPVIHCVYHSVRCKQSQCAAD